MKINKTTINVIHGDITTLKVDAIVASADPKLSMKKGTSVAIKNRGGEIIERQAEQKGLLKPGSAVWTNAGKIKAGYIIHAVTKDKHNKTSQDILRIAIANTLEVANSLKVKSLALPALGCGVGNFSIMGSAKIMTQEIMKAVNKPENNIEEITFCIFDETIFDVFSKTVQTYVDHLQNTLGPGPYITVDIIIEHGEGIILIERSNPPFGLALPGGFLDRGESLEGAAIREAKEETNLDLKNLQQFHTYSDPARDPRFHTVSTVFIARGEGTPKSGSDAATIKVVKFADLLKLNYAFDHKQVIGDYLALRKK